jgi:hypothetical protein
MQPPPFPPLWLDLRQVTSKILSYFHDQLAGGSAGKGLGSQGIEREDDLSHGGRVPGRLPFVGRFEVHDPWRVRGEARDGERAE